MTIRKHVPSYKSKSEVKVAEQLGAAGVEVEYEAFKIKYVIPESQHKYTPDFILPNGIILEVKGILTLADRQKHLFVKQQHPDLDIRFVFDRSKDTIAKKSKTTYADWCTKNGFLCADKLVPQSWLLEPPKGLDAKS